MKERLILILTFCFILLSALFIHLKVKTDEVYAGDEACPPGDICYDLRRVNSWNCSDCAEDGQIGYYCSGPINRGCEGRDAYNLPFPDHSVCGGGTCLWICNPSWTGSCDISNGWVPCNTSPGACRWDGFYQDCGWESGKCSETQVRDSLGCCGPGGATPTPEPCNCPSWTNQNCGGGGCEAWQMYQTRACNPAGCGPESRCSADCACVVCDPTWTDQGCELGGCAANEMYQTRNCTPSGCPGVPEEQCVVDPTCAQCFGMTAPSNPIVSNLTETAATLSWNDGWGGTTQYLRIGEIQADVEGDPTVPCASCDVDISLAIDVNTYSTGDILTPDTTYYWRVIEYDAVLGNWMDFGNACNTAFSESFLTLPTVSSCTIVFPVGGYSLILGETSLVAPSIVPVGSPVDHVDFLVNDFAFATVCQEGTGPCPAGSGSYTDGIAPFQADLTGQDVGSTTIDATAELADGTTCQDSTTIDVSSVNAWWQVKEGDAMCIGNISSDIPATATDPYFMSHDVGDLAGIPIYSGSINTGSGEVSDSPAPPGWRAEGAAYSSVPKDYQYFWNRVQSSITPEGLGATVDAAYLRANGAVSGGYRWFQRTGDLDLTGGDIQDQKVIVFVDGNLTISDNLNLTNGLGFLLAVVSGDITIDSAVGEGAGVAPHVEGMFVSDGQFITQTSGTWDEQLHIRGSVVGLGGLSLNRSLYDNSTDPAEIFEYGVDQAFLYPINLGIENFLWREIAP